MKHSRAERENTWNIDMAARWGKPGGGVGGIDGAHLLHLGAVRDVPLPGPVDVAWVNGRPPGGWLTEWPFALLPPASAEVEEALIRGAREQERRVELALLAGTREQP